MNISVEMTPSQELIQGQSVLPRLFSSPEGSLTQDLQLQPPRFLHGSRGRGVRGTNPPQGGF